MTNKNREKTVVIRGSAEVFTTNGVESSGLR